MVTYIDDIKGAFKQCGRQRKMGKMLQWKHMHNFHKLPSGGNLLAVDLILNGVLKLIALDGDRFTKSTLVLIVFAQNLYGKLVWLNILWIFFNSVWLRCSTTLFRCGVSIMVHTNWYKSWVIVNKWHIVQFSRVWGSWERTSHVTVYVLKNWSSNSKNTIFTKILFTKLETKNELTNLSQFWFTFGSSFGTHLVHHSTLQENLIFHVYHGYG